MGGDKPSREFMVPISPLIGEAFLQPCCQRFSMSSLCLSQTLCGTLQFVGMGDFLSRRQREQVSEAGITTNHPGAQRRNGVGAGSAWAWHLTRPTPGKTIGFPSGGRQGSGKGMLVSLLRYPCNRGRFAS
jgi:hypothetical protein